MTRPFSHLRLVLREIDFKLKIYQEKAYSQKKKWLNLFLRAQEEAAVAKKERDELEEYKQRQKLLEEESKQ